MVAKAHQRGRLIGGSPNPNELRRLFALFDTDGDGTIDLQEFRDMLVSHLHIVNVSDADIIDLCVAPFAVCALIFWASYLDALLYFTC